MYDRNIRRQALDLLERGNSLRSVSLYTGVARSTLRDWRARPHAGERASCVRCGTPPTLPCTWPATPTCSGSTLATAVSARPV